MDGRTYQSTTENPNSLTGLEILGLLGVRAHGSKPIVNCVLRQRVRVYGSDPLLAAQFSRSGNNCDVLTVGAVATIALPSKDDWQHGKKDN
jgi:hypothetical protein